MTRADEDRQDQRYASATLGSISFGPNDELSPERLAANRERRKHIPSYDRPPWCDPPLGWRYVLSDGPQGYGWFLRRLND